MSEPLTSFVLRDADWIQILPPVRMAQSTPLRKPNLYLIIFQIFVSFFSIYYFEIYYFSIYFFENVCNVIHSYS